MFKIYWKNKITGETGQSKEPMTLEIANSWIIPMNERYPDIEHKIIQN
jgi:hypothetical protein